MNKLLKVKQIIEKKVLDNRKIIESSVSEIAKANREINNPNITLRKYNSLKSTISRREKEFARASEQNKVFSTVLYIINNVLSEKE